jgi:hypothetical protein
MAIPQPWMALCQFLTIPEPLTRLVWAGLRRARWSAPVARRQAFLLPEPRQVPAGAVTLPVLQFPSTGLTAHAASPAQVIEAIEACVEEKVLTRRDASRFEPFVLDGMAYEPGAGAADRWLTLGERAARTARSPRA